MTQRNARRKKVSEKTFAVAKILQGKTSLRGDYCGLLWLRHGKPRAQFVPCLPSQERRKDTEQEWVKCSGFGRPEMLYINTSMLGADGGICHRVGQADSKTAPD